MKINLALFMLVLAMLSWILMGFSYEFYDYKTEFALVIPFALDKVYLTPLSALSLLVAFASFLISIYCLTKLSRNKENITIKERKIINLLCWAAIIVSGILLLLFIHKNFFAQASFVFRVQSSLKFHQQIKISITF